MKYVAVILFALALIGCESDTPPVIVLTKIHALDSAHIKYDSTIKTFVLDPVDSTVRFGILTSSLMHDSASLYTFSFASVGDSLRYSMRKPTYFLNDTFYLHYDNIVDSLTTEGTTNQFILDSILLVLPVDRTPTVVLRP
ncbi:MAG TPA: hypothetical protein VFO76_06720 [Candidatus Kapabacteria bacterium]|nr:hypothetical protein [Candidatus Kapabacteria bacterium]